MTALGIFPSTLFSQSADRNFCLHLFFRCYSSASRGLNCTFSRVNNIFRTLILFFRVVPELLRILHVDFHHSVAHCFILSVITARRKIDFFLLPFHCLKTCLMLLQFECDVSFLNLTAWISLYQSSSVPLR